LQNNKTAANKGFAASVAGRKSNRQFYKAKLQSRQDKQLSTSNLNFNKNNLIGSGCRRTEFYSHTSGKP